MGSDWMTSPGGPCKVRHVAAVYTYLSRILFHIQGFVDPKLDESTWLVLYPHVIIFLFLFNPICVFFVFYCSSIFNTKCLQLILIFENSEPFF